MGLVGGIKVMIWVFLVEDDGIYGMFFVFLFLLGLFGLSENVKVDEIIDIIV